MSGSLSMSELAQDPRLTIHPSKLSSHLPDADHSALWPRLSCGMCILFWFHTVGVEENLLVLVTYLGSLSLDLFLEVALFHLLPPYCLQRANQTQFSFPYWFSSRNVKLYLRSLLGCVRTCHCPNHFILLCLIYSVLNEEETQLYVTQHIYGWA